MNKISVSKSDVEKALKGEKREVIFDVWYYDNDKKYTYTNINHINFNNVRRLTLVFPTGSGENIYVGNGEWANKDRKKVRRST